MKDRLNEIDLFRFLAAMLVVFFHYSFRGAAGNDYKSVLSYDWLIPFAKYGYLGVEFFFMISGFVILMTAEKGNLKYFVISRIVRLYPAFWVACTLTFIFSILWGAAIYKITFIEYIINMTMLGGFVGVKPVDGVYWSLLVEIRFYVLIGVVIVLGQMKKIEWLMFLWLVISIIIELKYSSSILRQILITKYTAYFVAGAVFFKIWQDKLSVSRVLVIVLCYIFALFLSVKFSLKQVDKYNVDFNVFIIIGIMSLFFFLMFLTSIKKFGSFNKVNWVFLGSLTYPLYLIHQNIGYIIFNNLSDYINIHILFWGVIMIMLVVSWLIYKEVEQKYAKKLKVYLNNLSGVKN